MLAVGYGSSCCNKAVSLEPEKDRKSGLLQVEASIDSVQTQANYSS